MSEEIKRGRGRPAVAIAPEVVSDICTMYTSGNSVREIIAKVGVGNVIIKRVLKENGVAIRTTKKMA